MSFLPVINHELLFKQIEQKLKMDVGKWEEENERRFLINGCHYMDIITNQWAAFNAQKEQEILERVRNYFIITRIWGKLV